MPRISKQSAPDVRDFGPATDHRGQLGTDYTAEFVTIHQSHSLADMLKGLPGDRCPCPHWGYLLAGRITVGYPDHEEVIEAGDAFYMAPGHVPAAETGSEFVIFSPTAQLAEVEKVMMANAQRAMQATRP